MQKSFQELQLKARKQVYTLMSGVHLSSLRGESSDFFELREYQTGDDIRKINWMISAKLGTPYIQESHSHKEIPIVVVTLMDGSLYFAKGNAKQQKLTEIATILGYVCERQGDLFRGFGYTQYKKIITPPTKQLYRIEQFSKTLFEIPLLHTLLDTKTALMHLFKNLHQASLIFILGDFLEEVDLSLLTQKHEVRAIIIRDKEEESLPMKGEVTLVNPKNTIDPNKTFLGKKNQKRYLKHLQQHDEKLTRHFFSYGIRHTKILTNDDTVKKLLQLLH